MLRQFKLSQNLHDIWNFGCLYDRDKQSSVATNELARASDAEIKLSACEIVSQWYANRGINANCNCPWNEFKGSFPKRRVRFAV